MGISFADRNHLISFGNQEYDRTKITCGVPQGSIHGQLLFNIYMIHLGEIIEYCNVSHKILKF